MIEKLKLEPYIQESLVAKIYSQAGHLVAERYDTIYWVRDEFLNVACTSEFNCFVDAKMFCTFATALKEVSVVGNSVRLTLFNGAKYDLEMVKGENIPSFDFPELSNKSVFDFGGVENAVSKSPLQKDLNMVYVDSEGCVASDSIVAGVSAKFKSSTPFSVPEGIYGMVGGEEVEWDIIAGKLYISVGVHKIVAVLSKLSEEFDWWNASRMAFATLPEFVDISGFKGMISRLSNFGNLVSIQDGKIAVNSEHWEPFVLEGSGEMFDVTNLSAIAVDGQCGVALFGGNLYLKTKDAVFVCCSVDLSTSESSEESDEGVE